MNNTIIKFFNNKNIRFVEQNKNLFISANDVLALLGYADPRKAWNDLKPIVEDSLDRDVRKFPTWVQTSTTGQGRLYDMAYLDKDQLVVVLLKTNKPAAKPFLKWAVNIINTEIEKKIFDLEKENEILKSNLINFNIPSEETIRDQLIHLSAYCYSKYHWEFSVPDSFREGRARRWDAYRKFGRSIRILELKRELDSRGIDEVLNNRCYLELAASIHPNKCIDLVFIAPNITDSAKRTLERLGADKSYKSFTVEGISYRAKIRFMNLYDLTEEWINQKIKNTDPPKESWVLCKEAYSKWRNILSPTLLNSLISQFPVKNIAA